MSAASDCLASKHSPRTTPLLSWEAKEWAVMGCPSLTAHLHAHALLFNHPAHTCDTLCVQVPCWLGSGQVGCRTRPTMGHVTEWAM